jgi:hypothetical protein
MRGYRLGVARDEAFSFYYEENLRLMRESGMELVPFSPLRTRASRRRWTGLYFGGGFPEVFAEALEDNRAMRESRRLRFAGGMPLLRRVRRADLLEPIRGRPGDGRLLPYCLPHDGPASALWLRGRDRPDGARFSRP